MALSLVVCSALASRMATHVTAGPVSDSRSDGALAQIDSTATWTEVPVATQVPTGGSPRFEAAVERWRSPSSDAARTVQEATGVSLDENVLLALVAVESQGEPAARSPGGAVGLVQVEPATFEDLRARHRNLLPPASLEQPYFNLVAGALYLAECARMLGADVADPGGLALVLHAYNMGPRAAAEWRDRMSKRDQLDGEAEFELGLPTETAQHATRLRAAINSAGV